MSSHAASQPSGFLRSLACFLNILIVGTLLAVLGVGLKARLIPAGERGEYDSDLRVLRHFYTAPGESRNYVFDMVQSGSFTEFLKIHALTNNNALFVLSHGKALTNGNQVRFAYYPDDRVLRAKKVPYFSARDLAQVIGGEGAGKIHNVVVAGCNLEGAFDPAEIRKFFVNATNVVHTPAGKNGYEFVYRHALIHPSGGIKVLYQAPGTFQVGDFAESGPDYQRRARLGTYVAQLYEPHGLTPFKSQVAGRELLASIPPNTKPSEIDPVALSAAMESAASSLKKTETLPGTRSLIVVGAQRQNIRNHAREQWFRICNPIQIIDLSFLGLWEGSVLAIFVALAYWRTGTFLLLFASRLES